MSEKSTLLHLRLPERAGQHVARAAAEEKLITLVRALAIQAAREDHDAELRRRQRQKGGRPKKRRLKIAHPFD